MIHYKILGCTDTNCMFVKNTIGTNGGCKCIESAIDDRQLARELKFAFKRMQATGSAILEDRT